MYQNNNITNEQYSHFLYKNTRAYLHRACSFSDDLSVFICTEHAVSVMI